MSDRESHGDAVRVREVREPEAGRTVASLIRAWNPGLSWNAVRGLLSRRTVLINGVVCDDEARRVSEGDLVQVADRPRPQAPRAADLGVVSLDASIVVVEKPSGMLTERPKAEPLVRRKSVENCCTVEDLLPGVLREFEGRAARQRTVFMVHRLDRDASGLLVVARTEHAREQLVKQFAAHRPRRIYEAIVEGHVAEQTIRSHFIRDRGDGKRGSREYAATLDPNRVAPRPVADDGNAQLAITHVKPLATRRGRTLLECRLETGRTNQIRIHLSELGHPILGDVKYGRVSDATQVPRLALHAVELQFEHPVNGKPLHFVSPWPEELQSLWEQP